MNCAITNIEELLAMEKISIEDLKYFPNEYNDPHTKVVIFPSALVYAVFVLSFFKTRKNVSHLKHVRFEQIDPPNKEKDPQLRGLPSLCECWALFKKEDFDEHIFPEFFSKKGSSDTLKISLHASS